MDAGIDSLGEVPELLSGGSYLREQPRLLSEFALPGDSGEGGIGGRQQISGQLALHTKHGQ